MHIKWAALAQTAGVSFAITVTIVAIFALGILALNRREAAVETGRSGTGSLVGAGLCFAACAGVVFYGISIIATG